MTKYFDFVTTSHNFWTNSHNFGTASHNFGTTSRNIGTNEKFNMFGSSVRLKLASSSHCYYLTGSRRSSRRISSKMTIQCLRFPLLCNHHSAQHSIKNHDKWQIIRKQYFYSTDFYRFFYILDFFCTTFIPFTSIVRTILVVNNFEWHELFLC